MLAKSELETSGYDTFCSKGRWNGKGDPLEAGIFRVGDVSFVWLVGWLVGWLVVVAAFFQVVSETLRLMVATTS